MRSRLVLPALLAIVAAVGGCGGSSGGGGATTARTPTPAQPGPGAASDARVIRSWSDALRAGHLDAAARFFAVPVVVENGTPPLELSTREAVRAFNESLPCGARLVRTQHAGRYTVATFVLTDRRGGHCGTGVGQKAATAFAIRGGKIAEWRRVPLPASPKGPPAATSEA
jgi:hypothetical protein